MSKHSRRRHGNNNSTAERRRRQERTTQRDPWNFTGFLSLCSSRVRRKSMRPPSEMMLPRQRRVELYRRGHDVAGFPPHELNVDEARTREAVGTNRAHHG